MNFPDELKYTKDHEWIKLEGDIELGDIVYVDINTKGKELAANEIFGSVEAVKTVSDLFMPLSGTVTEINPDLNANPELVNSDPYGAGWMVKVSLTNAGDFETLLSSEEYKQQIGV